MTVSSRDRAIIERVIRAREDAGMQKQELAAKLGISGSGYSPYENFHNAFTVEQLYQISAILRRGLDYFLGLNVGLTADEDELLAAYRSAPVPEGRQMILQLVKAMVARR